MLAKGSHDHPAHWNVRVLAFDHGVAMCLTDIRTIPFCRPVPIPGYRLDEARDGAKGIGVLPPAVKHSPPFLDTVPTTIPIRGGPLLPGCFGIIVDCGIIATLTSPRT